MVESGTKQRDEAPAREVEQVSSGASQAPLKLSLSRAAATENIPSAPASVSLSLANEQRRQSIKRGVVCASQREREAKICIDWSVKSEPVFVCHSRAR